LYIKIPCDQVSFELKKMGVHPTGIALMAPKAVVEPLRLVGVRAPGANIIKQEMLAMGADAANAKGTINCSIERTDVILLGSRTQYRHLAHKLRANQGWFGLDEVIRDIEDYLTDHELATILADGRTLTYEKMRIMGILNVTPDSFYSGSRVTAGSLILKRAGKMLDDGADVLDIGGESTRPGSDPVPAEEEIRRVVGAISEIRRAYPEAILSVDTYHAATARAALDAGADIINDVSEGGITGIANVPLKQRQEEYPEMFRVVGELKVPYILMSVQPTLAKMLKGFAREVQQLRDLGAKDIILDPGFGFGKNLIQNYQIYDEMEKLNVMELPVLVGISRKSMIYKLLGGDATTSLNGTAVLDTIALMKGASILRVHDVKEAAEAVKIVEAMKEGRV